MQSDRKGFCSWSNSHDIYMKYHDNEWGRGGGIFMMHPSTNIYSKIRLKQKYTTKNQNVQKKLMNPARPQLDISA